MSSISTGETGCAGCNHRFEHEGGFCYMFRDKPETLSCAQHTKFEAIRKKVTVKQAAILAAFHVLSTK